MLQELRACQELMLQVSSQLETDYLIRQNFEPILKRHTSGQVLGQ